MVGSQIMIRYAGIFVTYIQRHCPGDWSRQLRLNRACRRISAMVSSTSGNGSVTTAFDGRAGGEQERP